MKVYSRARIEVSIDGKPFEGFKEIFYESVGRHPRFAAKPGDVVICRFPTDALHTRIAICIVVAVGSEWSVVRKSMGVPTAFRMHKHAWRWASKRRIPTADVIRLASDREKAKRQVIGGVAGEQPLSGEGAGNLR
ncbi:MAG: hypothetical protein V4537_14340 [Pseudomonadota bacterium]